MDEDKLDYVKCSENSLRLPQKKVEDRSLLLSISNMQISGVDCTKYLDVYI